MGLRIAARRDADGSVHYAMGFDDARDDDSSCGRGLRAGRLAGAPRSARRPDARYVEYEAGDFRFIFINPNDTGAAPPATTNTGAVSPAAPGGGGGGCGCAGGGGR